MSETLTALAYLVAAICFIMALRGLSSPEMSRAGNIYGMVGMAIAIATTLLLPEVESYWLIILGIAIGGAIGSAIALRIQMTALPQLVAAFHSLVGMAAVFVAAAAFLYPEAYGIEILPEKLRKKREFLGGTLFLIGAAALALAFLGLRAWRYQVDLERLEGERARYAREYQKVERTNRETIRLMEQGSWIAAGLYVVLTTALCLGGCAVGLTLGRLLVEGRGGW